MTKSIKRSFLIFTIIPLLTICIAAISLTYSNISVYANKSSMEEMKNAAFIVASSIESMYPGEYHQVEIDGYNHFYKGDVLMEGKFEYFDILKERTQYDITLCRDNIRVITTLEEDGKSLGGTYISDEVWNNIVTDNSGVYQHGTIGTNDYSCFYLPIGDSNGNLEGIIAVAKPWQTVNDLQSSVLKPLLAVIIFFSILMIIIVYSYGKEIVDCIKTIQIFINYLTKEKFNSRLDDSIYNREDELGDIGRDITVMRNSMKNLVEIDPLTGLYNRRTANKKYQIIKNRCIKNKRPFCFCICDIDHFKKVNDTYGHDAGDAVLEEIASILKENIAKSAGFISRWGGEEFVICLEGVSSKRAYAILENILNIIRDKTIYYKSHSIKITMTMGVVELGNKRMQELPDDEIFEIADKKLYKGKTSGRNQIVL